MGVPGQSFFETADLLVQYLNEHLDSVTIQMVACADINDYQTKLRNGDFDATIINGPQLLEAEHHGYRVVGRITDDSRTVIFVHKDSGIRQFGDIPGHTIALPGNNTLSGTIMPLLYLYRHGVDVKHLRRLYVGSFDSDILSVYLGHASMGTVWKPEWQMILQQRPEIARKLEARWESPPIINAGLLFRLSTRRELTEKVAGLFFQIGKDEEGRRALRRLNITGFERADSSSFRPMEAVLREYESVIQ